MNEIEEIKRRKLEELKSQEAEQIQQQAQIQQEIGQLETIVKQFFTKSALERYGNLKIAHPEKAMQLLIVLGQAAQAGQLGRIDDIQLKEILTKLTQKKEFKIKRV